MLHHEHSFCDPMARRQPASTPANQPSAGRVRWPIGIVVGALVLVGSAWVWQTNVYPRQLYRRAERVLEQDPRRAADLLEEAVTRSGGEFPEAQLLWSRAFLRLGQPREALGCFSLIAEPGSLDAADLIALADEARQAGEQLLATFALAAVPEGSELYADACHRLMEIKSEEGRYAEVVALGEQVASRGADTGSTALLMAYAHEQLADFPAAIAAYETALEAPDEEHPERTVLALRRLTRLAIRLGRFDLARSCLDKLRERGSLTTEDRLNQAELLRLEGKIDAAWMLVGELLEGEPSNLAAIELHAALAFDRGDDAVAESDLRRVLRSQPWNKAAHYKLAQVLQRTGRRDEAETHFSENRRLTELSVRVLDLQNESFAETEREAARLRELSKLYSELGQSRRAAQIQERLREMQQGTGS